MKLYEINDAIEQAFINATDRETGEINMDEVVDALADLDMLRELKVLNTAAYIMGLRTEADAAEATAKAIRAQAHRHSERADVLDRQADRLQEYLEQHVQPGEKFEDSRVRIGWRKSERINVTDLTKLSSRFVRAVYSPIKSEIRQAIKDGETVEGAELEERQNIQIKP